VSKTTTTNNQNEALTPPTYWTQRQRLPYLSISETYARY
jgi:hypothetical protein